jgi:hypothetical protein
VAVKGNWAARMLGVLGAGQLGFQSLAKAGQFEVAEFVQQGLGEHEYPPQL